MNPRRYDYQIRSLIAGKWELQTTETTLEAARQRLLEYRENVPGVKHMIYKKSVVAKDKTRY